MTRFLGAKIIKKYSRTKYLNGFLAVKGVIDTLKKENATIDR